MSQQINLYSPIFRKQQKVFSATTMLQGVLLIVLVVGVFYYTVSLQSSLLEIRATDSGRQLQCELERLKAYGVRGESPAERAKALADRKKPSKPVWRRRRWPSKRSNRARSGAPKAMRRCCARSRASRWKACG